MDYWPTATEPSHNNSEQVLLIFLSCRLWKAPQTSPGPGVENGQPGPGHQVNQQPLLCEQYMSVFLLSSPSHCLILGLSMHLNNLSGSGWRRLLWLNLLPCSETISTHFANLRIFPQCSTGQKSKFLKVLEFPGPGPGWPLIKAVYLVFSKPQFLHL